MTRSHRVTEEQIAAAQLRLLLDEKQGRTTPDVVRSIANSVTGDEVVSSNATPSAAPSPETGEAAAESGRRLVATVEDYRRLGLHEVKEPRRTGPYPTYVARDSDSELVAYLIEQDVLRPLKVADLLREFIDAAQPEEREQIIRLLANIIHRSQEADR